MTSTDSENDYTSEESAKEDEIAYFEESSESEPEIECDLWDQDCKVITSTPSSLIGYHLLPTCSRDPEVIPRKKSKILPEINNKLLDCNFLKTLQEHWNKNEKFLNADIELIAEPFKVCVIHNFLNNGDVLNDVRQEFNELDWNMRNMDLYEFFQSKDLKYLNSEYINIIFNFLKTDVMEWVSNLMGYPLTHISATCSLYSNTDYLLVHDDQREDRMVAFVLYLTGKSGWNQSKGGALQLLNKDEKSQPNEIVRDIFPANNQLVLFPVTNDSYHQVAEVTCIDDCRLSINGWFHVKSPPVFKQPIYLPLNDGLYSRNYIKAKEVDIDLESWISEEYLNPKSVKLIQRHIEENSEISLRKFFKMECFSEISHTLESYDIIWTPVGPPNRYHYEKINLCNLPHILERFLDLFQSRMMFSLLQQYTDLELTTSNASMKFELQRWSCGNYCLLSDFDWNEKNELDLVIYFGCSKSADVIGARTQYVTIEDEIQNALITLEPEENNLNIVYRDSARFTKYFSKQSRCKKFFALVCSYAE
ncbi:prolyl 3-hydroxylase OGFOD1 [Diorhabda carinulata]|uniref:prolyl 3-hydroxylase OGFOD1 n=1 Tax=Diorhabda sublineata TaxID=1163346 RepID=UPI0024E11FBA|nr:prolyl 3-hydroxylase OGFOD1 [Diorhabda sublineata]XP_057652612.1 prolyl 3-hydroxylase OGFOD1 [Diorhabda carinulata]